MWDVKLCTMICVNVDIYVCNIIYVLSVKISSPYLRVFGDDRVRGTRAQSGI